LSITSDANSYGIGVRAGLYIDGHAYCSHIRTF
jgi:hypothetical protein